jgi:hypothetical protein
MNRSRGLDVQGGQKLTAAFRVIALLLGIAVAEAVGIAYLLYRDGSNRHHPENLAFVSPTTAGVNVIRQAFPNVDFTRIYPGLTTGEIDQLQRECLGVRYVYSPFVQFRPIPVSNRFVKITDAGFRRGWRDQPWPPVREDFVVFVFGGSTAFSYGLPDGQTLPVMIEKELAGAMPDARVQCYNFGQGYFFSTQERILFEQLLTRGTVPDVAIFIDGLNDFYYPDGRPELTNQLYRFTAPDLPVSPSISLEREEDRIALVRRILNRYRNNLRIITYVATAYGVAPIFVGQPVPFMDFPRNDRTYPFPFHLAGHDLCQWGYRGFRQAGLDGVFGERFIWCGDAFEHADEIMYVDSIHYSSAGVKQLARDIVVKSFARGLIPESPTRSAHVR